MTTPIKILSCDGGGIRGLLTTIILETLEKEIQRINPKSSLHDSFDVFAGTSTGSIIACGLARGMSASQIRKFYVDKGEIIFPKLNLAFWAGELLDRLKKGHFSQPLCDPKGLESVLRLPDVFPDDLLFGNLKKEALVVSYDTFNRKAIVFKSKGNKSAKIPVWQVCRASAAAPAAYPGFLLKESQFLSAHQAGGNVEGDLPRMIPEEGLPLIDGGVLANNPTLCAVAEQFNKHSEAAPPGQEYASFPNLLVASFGTGQSGRRITPKDVKNWGVLAWSDLLRSIPLYQVCADGSADSIDFIAASLLGARYQRYQPVYTEPVSAFQADPGTLEKLQQTAKTYLSDPSAQQRLRDLAQSITPS
ncbi:MAG: patatin-like phospholipase family protein [Cyanobacteriota bacterium]